jgi:hypothetical protein
MIQRLPLAAALLLAAAPALANDSEAGIALGGLVLRPSKTVSMDAEDLYISADEIRVKYRFTNSGPKPVTTLIAFPLPDMPGVREFEDGEPAFDIDRINFSTLVDGKPASLGVAYTATVRGRNIKPRLDALGWPVRWQGDEELAGKIAMLTDEDRAARVAEGLLVMVDGAAYPAWRVTPHVTRTQTFPAGKSVSVEHRYAPWTGGSVSGALYASMRKEYPDIVADYQKRYCTDAGFWAGFDKREAARVGTATEGMAYAETWISYILKSGANWKGPIKDFRLVVDKGSASALVSFCANGVKKISPTQFEVRKTNYEPDRDLDVLIVK